MKVLASGSSTGVVHQSEWNCSILSGSWVANLPSIAKTQTELPVISAWWSLSCLKDGPRYPIRFRHVSAAFLVGNRPEKTWNGEQMTWDTGPDGPWPRSPVAYCNESIWILTLALCHISMKCIYCSPSPNQCGSLFSYPAGQCCSCPVLHHYI